MVTRTTSKPTEKTDTEMNVNGKQKAAKRASNKAKSGTTKIIATEKCTYSKWNPMDEAYCLFMRDRKVKYYQKHPPLKTCIIIPEELSLAIRQEWRDMSDKDKAPFVKSAKKLKVEERSIYR